MESPYRVKIVPCESGERFPLLVNRNDGIPLFYPCVYLTSEVRSGARQDATLKRHLYAIKFLYDWGLKYHIDVEHRFFTGRFLTIQEIDLIAQDAFIRADALLKDVKVEDTEPATKTRKKVAEMEGFRAAPVEVEEEDIVNSDTAGTRLWHISRYLDWLAVIKIRRVATDSPEYPVLVAARDLMLQLFEHRIPDKSDTMDPKMGLTKEAEQRILEVIDPNSPENPWKDKRVRVRNQLFIYMLLLLGIRRGEALKIYLDDINLSSGTVIIHRRPNDKNDTRLHQPQAKTLPRKLPMNKELTHLCRQYMLNHRLQNLPAARGNGFLFLSTKSGTELTIRGADKICVALRKVPGIPINFTNHICRHTWNDRYSEKADEKIKRGEWTFVDEERGRKEKMGWRPKSRMPERYSKRHIATKSDALSLDMQNELVQSVEGGNDNS